MATNNMEVKCNFASVFAKYDTVDELRSIANNICGQVKEAFDIRVAEIKSGNAGTTVEVKVSSTKDMPKTEGKSKTPKGKATGAKEMAEKFKEQEKMKKADTREDAKDKADDDVLIAITDTKAIRKLGLTFEKYNDKCWVLRGNTKPLRKVLKEQFKGVYNSRLNGGEGWVFRTAEVEQCANALGLSVKVA